MPLKSSVCLQQEPVSFELRGHSQTGYGGQKVLKDSYIVSFGLTVGFVDNVKKYKILPPVSLYTLQLVDAVS